jgi:hypothetical protein
MEKIFTCYDHVKNLMETIMTIMNMLLTMVKYLMETIMYVLMIIVKYLIERALYILAIVRVVGEIELYMLAITYAKVHEGNGNVHAKKIR